MKILLIGENIYDVKLREKSRMQNCMHDMILTK